MTTTTTIGNDDAEFEALVKTHGVRDAMKWAATKNVSGAACNRAMAGSMTSPFAKAAWRRDNNDAYKDTPGTTEADRAAVARGGAR